MPKLALVDFRFLAINVVLPNRKQLAVVGTSDVIDLLNAVAEVFTVGIPRSRVWNVYWVNLYLFLVDDWNISYSYLPYFQHFLYLRNGASEAENKWKNTPPPFPALPPVALNEVRQVCEFFFLLLTLFNFFSFDCISETVRLRGKIS